MRLCLVIGGLVSLVIFVPTLTAAEDRDCRRYVPEIGMTIRVPCDDTPAPPAVVPLSRDQSADRDRCLNENTRHGQ